ncbi:adenosylcobinamide-GDP ribazoletransferase [Ideonella sp. B7]|uniref:adenosylcobinamide-GDP ribazoletransferase n=1 Tax=Ideonella benzenivorans TaxID=2831643 RepID=UPI001CECA147|nr:adenosylcobinamide-GDP ribazoletransferase [Ideonella benzenivorans]MCA6215755.1 adenosylcobinamide-GDP ribazoletransferase [Ideonella benzenivorans]
MTGPEVVPPKESAWRGELRLFLTALQFFTRLPVPAWVGWSAAQLNASARHFPSVGWLVGAVVGTVLWGGAQLWSPGVGAWLAIAAGVLLTGAFHEDGLADSCDGFGGAWQREQVLAIMKDSRVGSYATLGVVITLGLKAQLLMLLAERALGWWAIVGVTVSAHALSRWAALWVMARLSYVREDALSKSKPIAQGVARGPLLFATLVAALPLFTQGLAGVSAAVSALLMAGLAVRYLRRRLGGYVGDALGATQQLTELVLLLSLLSLPPAVESLSRWH